MRVTARCQRVGKFWSIDVVGVDGGHTQAKRLDQVEAVVKDAVSFLCDVPADDVDVSVDIDWGESAVDVEAFHDARREEVAAAARAANVARESIDAMQQRGLSMRDIAHAFGVSHQRVQQMSKG